jgi:hypothetical protein
LMVRFKLFVTDAASLTNGSYAQIVCFAKFGPFHTQRLFVRTAANGSREPRVSDAALRTNGGLAQCAVVSVLPAFSSLAQRKQSRLVDVGGSDQKQSD